jgi:hypothetical protein
MKNSIKRSLWAIVICALGGFLSCSDMLETNSNSYLNTDDNRLNSANDSLYSVIGIVKQLQSLGERYVVLGELRGDLMDVTQNASMDLQAIAGFTATVGNPYLSTREYYAVINNCNYFLQHVDTTVVAAGRKVLLGEYARVKTIRAWTYLQLGLNYGKATWLTEPLLTIEDMNRKYEEIPLEDLLFRLIVDMNEMAYVKTEDYPVYGNINGMDARYALIDPAVLMADLYLWYGTCTGDIAAYTAAAFRYYRALTYLKQYEASVYYNAYTDSEFKNLFVKWNTVYGNYPAEAISIIRYNDNFVENPNMAPLTMLCLPGTADTYWIKPSQAAMDLWKNEIYTHYQTAQKNVVYTRGDLRGQLRISRASDPYGSYDYIDTNEADSVPYITKYGYFLMNTPHQISNVSIYRDGLLYLKYAEALNALGKPSLAFAVLKYGMKAEVLTDSTKVAPDEINPLPGYCDFMDSSFSEHKDNHGLHARGSGNAEYDTLYYAFTPQTLAENRAYYGIPEKLETKEDSIALVNVMICKEFGMETAFEGNRFHDLMRLSKQHERLTGKSDFLAKWVGRRDPALESKLVNPDNWYLPFK